jgi:hypothetical protein
MNVFEVRQTKDQGVLLTGQVYMHSEGSDGFLMKTDMNGVIEWLNVYGGPNTEYFKSFQLTTDEIYLIGTTNSYGSGYFDAWLVKTDLNGTEQWNTSFGGPLNDEGFSLDICQDHGIIITGYTFSYGNGSSDLWIIKTNHEGIFQWDLTPGGPLQDKGFFISETMNHQIIIIGSQESDGWMVKLNPSVSIQLRPMLMIGSIQKFQKEDTYSIFQADKLLIIDLTSIQQVTPSSYENIYILNQEKGLLTSCIILGIYKGGIK